MNNSILKYELQKKFHFRLEFSLFDFESIRRFFFSFFFFFLTAQPQSTMSSSSTSSQQQQPQTVDNPFNKVDLRPFLLAVEQHGVSIGTLNEKVTYLYALMQEVQKELSAMKEANAGSVDTKE